MNYLNSVKGEKMAKKGESGFDLPDMGDALAAVSGGEVELVDDSKVTAVPMAFVGAGQGGCKMADTFYVAGYQRVLLLNTTDQDFRGIKCPRRLIIGDDVRGAGKDPELGARVYSENTEEVLSAMKQAFGKEVEQVMVCVGAGGGTGGGAVFGIIDTVREFLKTHGKPTAKIGVLVSNPANSEGSAIVRNAQAQIQKLCDLANEKIITPLVIAENAKILRIYPNTKLGARWDVINKSVCGIFDAFNVLACQSSAYATFDHQDYRKILDSGIVLYGRSVLGTPKSKTDLSDAIRKNLKNGFLADGLDLGKASVAGCILVAPKDVLEDIEQEAYDMAFETLQRVIGSENVVMYQGIIANPDVAGINLFTIVGGLQRIVSEVKTEFVP